VVRAHPIAASHAAQRSAAQLTLPGVAAPSKTGSNILKRPVFLFWFTGRFTFIFCSPQEEGAGMVLGQQKWFI